MSDFNRFGEPVFILAVLCVNVVISEWLVRRTYFRHFGTALMVIMITAVTSNLGVIPTSTADAPVYDVIFEYVAQIAIFWLLLGINLRDILKAGLPMIGIFLVGSVGTIIGVIVGMWLLDGPNSIGPSHFAIGGMFAATYTGGSINFNAIAVEYKVVEQGVLYTASVAVDNIATTVWMIATIALPRILVRVWPRGVKRAAMQSLLDASAADRDSETAGPANLALLAAMAFAAVWASDVAAVFLKERGLVVPGILILTTIALLLAQWPIVARLSGARLLGMFAVYIFLAVIGAVCDLAALRGIGSLATTLLLFVVIAVSVHGFVTFGVAALFRVDPAVAAVASQANVGGGTTALALARSLARPDLVLPGILVGSLGTAIGTYLGLAVADWLR